MSMKLGYDLTIEQAQKLVMTPELIQAIQILQFNTQELDSFIQEQILVNPVLEQGNSDVSEANSHDVHAEHFDEEKKEAQTNSKEEEFDWKEYLKDRQYDDISYRQGEYKGDDDKDSNYERYVSSDVTLPEHLMFQLQFVSCEKATKKIGKYIIESLDENGYMTLSPKEIENITGADSEQVKEALDIIHTFEPIGVGAEDLKECLLI
ncbi:MAG: RNA polymerase sigma-54 factor, partial [Anaerovoracaceae bacterium]